MFARGVRRRQPYRHASATIPFRLLVRGVSNCAQHLRDSTVSVRRGQSAIVPSSPEVRDCRSAWLVSPCSQMPNCFGSVMDRAANSSSGSAFCSHDYSGDIEFLLYLWSFNGKVPFRSPFLENVLLRSFNGKVPFQFQFLEKWFRQSRFWFPSWCTGSCHRSCDHDRDRKTLITRSVVNV